MPSTVSRRSRSTRRYQHFCPAARALETIGERWSLLIVRDLLAGPRRFSDLRRSLTAITPKWLSARLRTLEADGIVTRDVTGEREVRYRLTPKGEALEPVFDAVLVWGMDYALGPRWSSMVATARSGTSRRHRADLPAGVGEVSERGPRGPTSLAAATARRGNKAASRRADDLIRSPTTDVALTRTWKSASGHGQELRMRCFNPTC